MPQKTPTTGQCALCGNEFSKRMMTTHLASCDKRSVKKKAGSAFHIIVEYPYNSRYWLHIEAASNATLRQLDDFLRDIWLECCGHMSAFRIGDQGYSAPQAIVETGDRNMNIRLDAVLIPDLTFQYEYDFGSTTELVLSVLSQGDPKTAERVALLARNSAPVFPCIQCKKEATDLCVDECLWENGPEGAALCKKCSREHKCDKEMRLPIVNSPRTGVCGYEG